ncbi:MAG: radical SAM protein [Chloroflexi bacterium]|nr:radical SAM protein [Chloroflexota bacterium]
MRASDKNYIKNLVKLARHDQILNPLVVTFHITSACNLNCFYCEDFGARLNSQLPPPLPLKDSMRVMEIIRQATDNIVFTGGEPMLYPQIDELVAKAKLDLGFESISILSNGSLLDQHESLLVYIDRLVISLESSDQASLQSVTNASSKITEKIIDNIKHYSKRQGELGFVMIINCVLTPETISEAEQLLEFCLEHNLIISFSPQAVNNWPRYELLISSEFKLFIAKLQELKKRGAPILGSYAYLKTLEDFNPFQCYPSLVPRVMPNGDLIYPCRPIEKENGTHGGRPCNLLEVNSWEEALNIAYDQFGPPPRVCTSCFQQCFAEPSLMQARPFSHLRELLLFPSSRKAKLSTYSPG